LPNLGFAGLPEVSCPTVKSQSLNGLGLASAALDVGAGYGQIAAWRAILGCYDIFAATLLH
jgi:hypothetical protein